MPCGLELWQVELRFEVGEWFWGAGLLSCFVARDYIWLPFFGKSRERDFLRKLLMWLKLGVVLGRKGVLDMGFINLAPGRR